MDSTVLSCCGLKLISMPLFTVCVVTHGAVMLWVKMRLYATVYSVSSDTHTHTHTHTHTYI